MTADEKYPVTMFRESGTAVKGAGLRFFKTQLHKKRICLVKDPTPEFFLSPPDVYVQADVKGVVIMENVLYSHCDRTVARAMGKIDLIFSSQKQLNPNIPPNKILWFPFGQVWTKDIADYSYDKTTFGVSYLPGKKHISCFPGHQVRRDVSALLQNPPALHKDLTIKYFSPSNYIKRKDPVFDGVQYSIVIENSRRHGYFTEKLNDAINTKTIPIYWGAPDIGEYFDMDGILPFATTNELTTILRSLAPDMYEKKIDAINRNREILFEKYQNMMKMIAGYLSENYE